MVTRVTTLQSSNTMLDYIMNTESHYNELAQQSSSGLRVDEPSDDPVATKSILSINAEINELNNYINSMVTAQSEIDIVDDSLASLTNLIQEASDYATQAANGTYTTEDLANIKTQVDQIIQSVVDLANTDYNGKHVFSGTATSTEPYSITYDLNGNITDVTYNGTTSNEYERYVTISEGVSVAINLRGNDVFGSYDSSTSTATGLLGDLVTLSNALDAGDTATINSCIDSLDTDLDTATTSRTKLAAVTNRFDLTKSTLDSTITTLTGYRSELRDADLTEVLTNLALAETALQATYQVTSKLMGSATLLDYI